MAMAVIYFQGKTTGPICRQIRQNDQWVERAQLAAYIIDSESRSMEHQTSDNSEKVKNDAEWWWVEAVIKWDGDA